MTKKNKKITFTIDKVCIDVGLDAVPGYQWLVARTTDKGLELAGLGGGKNTWGRWAGSATLTPEQLKAVRPYMAELEATLAKRLKAGITPSYADSMVQWETHNG